MKVALVYPRFQWFEYNGLSEPLGVMHLVSALREAGHEPVYMDYSFCKEITDLDHLVQGAGIVAVAISAAAKLERASFVTTHLKTVVPDALFVVGGAYPSIFADKSIEGTGADIAMLGEAEEAIVELADIVEKGEDFKNIRNLAYRLEDGSFKENPRRPVPQVLDDISFPARDVVDYDSYLANGMSEYGVVTTRGCPFKCIYCKPSTDLIYGGGIRYRSASNVVTEIKELVELRNDTCPKIFFKDDTITMHPESWFETFRDELKEADIDLEWHCNSRVDTVSRDKIRIMKESGCHVISFGVESGSQRILDFYKKETTPEQAVEAFTWCHEFKVEATANLMIGFPLETDDDLRATYELLKKLKPDDIIVYFSTAIPGRYIHDWAAENGYLTSDTNPELLDPARNRAHEVMNMRLPHMKIEDVVSWKHRIERYRSWRKVTSFSKIRRWTGELLSEPGKAMGKAGRVLRGFKGQGD
ncbi:MAG: radical SAM protein [Candidatus Sabulitectum sp.]|nr:radical SAM protein [Candidatus Sabulitectum sp.]